MAVGALPPALDEHRLRSRGTLAILNRAVLPILRLRILRPAGGTLLPGRFCRSRIRSCVDRAANTAIGPGAMGTHDRPSRPTKKRSRPTGSIRSRNRRMSG